MNEGAYSLSPPGPIYLWTSCSGLLASVLDASWTSPIGEDRGISASGEIIIAARCHGGEASRERANGSLSLNGARSSAR